VTKEENKVGLYGSVEDRWMRIKKRILHSCIKLEIIESLNVMPVCLAVGCVVLCDG
jgi:hypothetical protein